MCRDTHTQHGAAAKAYAARSYLFEMISGRPVRQLSNDGSAQTCTVMRSRGAGDIALSLTPQLAGRLYTAGQRFLSDHSIDEPLTWHPPLRLLDGLDLPGDDPGLVDLETVHRLADRPGITIGSIARQLDTTLDVVRHLLIEPPPRCTAPKANDFDEVKPVRRCAQRYLHKRSSSSTTIRD